MGNYVGVDWAAGRWVAVALDGDGGEVSVHPTLLTVWHAHSGADLVLVDVPIGLPADGRRECDELAREYLGERASSVFLTPVREAVSAESYAEASRRNRERTGDGLSSQTWNILPRVREADVFLREFPAARDGSAAGATVREAHPEVCFAAFAGEPLATSKHDDGGVEERLAVLGRVDPSLPDLYERTVESFVREPPRFARRLSKTATDDIADAAVLALAARESGGDPSTLPADPPIDAAGHPMEICYHEP
ncbi:DUF429 domain-containing protein [Halobacteriales archaeon QS_1_68_17]|nr:MAG: DUF429 domain-containing protein [Halobacteriales archaeon QS_1_68_17]